MSAMAVPKRKTSKSKRNMRRSHEALPVESWIEDSSTGEAKRRHHIDLKTGTYKGKQIIEGRD
jgi:large subunit ribosomal protein L32